MFVRAGVTKGYIQIVWGKVFSRARTGYWAGCQQVYKVTALDPFIVRVSITPPINMGSLLNTFLPQTI